MFHGNTDRGSARAHQHRFLCFSPDLDLYFLSYPTSRHATNLLGSPLMAVAIFDSHQVWGAPHVGLQLFGAGRIVERAKEEEARRLYTIRFPGARDMSDSALRFYRFTPARITILDETEFGNEVFVTADIER